MENKTKRQSKIKYILNDMYLETLLLYLTLFFIVGYIALVGTAYSIGRSLKSILELIFRSNLDTIIRLAKFFLSPATILTIGVLTVLLIVTIRLVQRRFLQTLLIYNIFKYYKRDFKVYKGLVLPILFSIALILYFFLRFINDFDLFNVIMLFLILIIFVSLLNYAEQVNKIMHNINNIGASDKRDIPDIGSSDFTLESKKMLDNIDENIQISIENQLKSERLKTELITNISHDLKTPLTSIINYTDLLKSTEIEDETALDYIDALDRNSKRLKLLITDLVDASKTETGNVNIELEKLELNELISQVYGEFDSIFEEKEITFVFNPEEDIYVFADGNHLGRVLENIIGNASKYSQEKTRVYGDVRLDGDFVSFTLKNTSKDELNLSPDELMEQFVRGERSRHTEGSGLGLYIARNLMELMNGELTLSINGDLFEVKLLIPRIANS